MKCKAPKCICLVQFTQYAMCKFISYTTRHDIDHYNINITIRWQLDNNSFLSLSLFPLVFYSSSSSYTLSQTDTLFPDSQHTVLVNSHIYSSNICCQKTTIFTQKKKKHLQKNICRRNVHSCSKETNLTAEEYVKKMSKLYALSHLKNSSHSSLCSNRPYMGKLFLVNMLPLMLLTR